MRAGESEQGVDGTAYTVVPRILCFLRHGEEVLLLKGAPGKRRWAGRYNGVGGHVERGEDICQAAQREVREETGLEVADLRLGGVVHVALSAGPGVVLFVFAGTAASHTVRPSPEGMPEWVPLARVASLPLVDDVAVLLERLLAAGPADPPFLARSGYDEAGGLHVEFST